MGVAVPSNPLEGVCDVVRVNFGAREKFVAAAIAEMASPVSHSDDGKVGQERNVYFEEESSSNSSSSECESTDESEEDLCSKSHRPPRLWRAWSSLKLPAR